MVHFNSSNEVKMARFILSKGKTNYQEIADYMNLSKRTVANYLAHLEQALSAKEVKLVIKQNTGVYFQGETKNLEKIVAQLESDIPSSKDERIMYVYMKFLTASGYLKVQDLADELFVSRSTLEGILKEVRNLFAKEGVEIESSRNGLHLSVNEKKKRQLLSKLINRFLSEYKINIDVPGKMNTNKFSKDIERILNVETLKVVSEILYQFIDETQVVFTDYELQSLLIHLVIAIDRIQKEKFLSQPIQSQLCEHTITLVSMLEKRLAIKMPDYEKEYINIHILAVENKGYRENLLEEREVVEKNSEIYLSLQQILAEIQPDQGLLNNLSIHLNAAIKRLELGLSVYNPYTKEIKLSFTQAFEEALNIKNSLEEKYNIFMNDDEVSFIALHIEAFFERHRKGTFLTRKKRVVLVCSSGLGTSMLLKQRLEKYFAEEIMVTRVLSYAEYQHTQINEDVIISTIPVEDRAVPSVIVSPLFNARDHKKVSNALKSSSLIEASNESFMSLIDKNLIFIDSAEKSSQQVIQKICDELIARNYASKGVYDSAIEREQLSSTAFDYFAMPHANFEWIVEPKIVVYINSNGINWGDSHVKVVFFFAMNEQVKEKLDNIYQYFNELISSESLLHQIAKQVDVMNVIEILKKGSDGKR